MAGLLAAAAGCGGGRDAAPAVRGSMLYAAYCAPCHTPAGLGMEGGGPPLQGSPWVRGPESRLVRIVLHGLRGPIEVKGEVYDREMLSFGPVLDDRQIAALLTHVRSRYGPAPPVAEATVARIREETRDRAGYWTVPELLEFR